MTDPVPHLVIAGSGMNCAEHLTPIARHWIVTAQRVFYLIGDPAGERLLKTLNPAADDLAPCYDESLPRQQSYRMMIDLIVGSLLEHATVCAVFYGHPGVFVNPSHDAIRRARSMGFQATMLPGISAEDCLFADLGVDPSRSGCHCYEATDFLTRRRLIDPTVGLVLWQVDGLGVLTAECMTDGFRPPHLDILAEVLAASYGPEHRVFVYEAAVDSGLAPRIEQVPRASPDSGQRRDDALPPPEGTPGP